MNETITISASASSITEEEKQILERLKRALVHRRESAKNYIALSSSNEKRCEVKIGLRSTLRSIQNGSAKVVIVARRGPQATVDLIMKLAKVKSIRIWSPAVSSAGLGGRLGIGCPCQALAISRDGKDTDPFVSIRVFILKNIAVNEEPSQESKRVKTDRK